MGIYEDYQGYKPPAAVQRPKGLFEMEESEEEYQRRKLAEATKARQPVQRPNQGPYPTGETFGPLTDRDYEPEATISKNEAAQMKLLREQDQRFEEGTEAVEPEPTFTPADGKIDPELRKMADQSYTIHKAVELGKKYGPTVDKAITNVKENGVDAFTPDSPAQIRAKSYNEPNKYEGDPRGDQINTAKAKRLQELLEKRQRNKAAQEQRKEIEVAETQANTGPTVADPSAIVPKGDTQTPPNGQTTTTTAPPAANNGGGGSGPNFTGGGFLEGMRKQIAKGRFSGGLVNGVWLNGQQMGDHYEATQGMKSESAADLSDEDIKKMTGFTGKSLESIRRGLRNGEKWAIDMVKKPKQLEQKLSVNGYTIHKYPTATVAGVVEDAQGNRRTVTAKEFENLGGGFSNTGKNFEADPDKRLAMNTQATANIADAARALDIVQNDDWLTNATGLLSPGARLFSGSNATTLAEFYERLQGESAIRTAKKMRKEAGANVLGQITEPEFKALGTAQTMLSKDADRPTQIRGLKLYQAFQDWAATGLTDDSVGKTINGREITQDDVLADKERIWAKYGLDYKTMSVKNDWGTAASGGGTPSGKVVNVRKTGD